MSTRRLPFLRGRERRGGPLRHTILAPFGPLTLALVGVGVTNAAATTPTGDAVARVDAYLGSLKTLGAQFLQVVRARD